MLIAFLIVLLFFGGGFWGYGRGYGYGAFGPAGVILLIVLLLLLMGRY